MVSSIAIERILSVNSEDSAFPAENLLKSGNKKWKCKLGEKQASVILQLQTDSLIEAIDIGNEHSAFVEVLVGRSSGEPNDFKVLLLTSSLMSLKESKDGTNVNGVRFFKKADLNKSVLEEKWDRVKLVCTQPFNKHVQYGLSFIVLHSSAKDSIDLDNSSSSLGRFTLKKDEDQPSVGAWFAKRKDPPLPVPRGAAAAIRDASSPKGIAQRKLSTPKRPKAKASTNELMKTQQFENPTKSPKPDIQGIKKPTSPLNMSIEDDEDSPADDTDADSTYSPNKESCSLPSDDYDVISDELKEVNDSDDDRTNKKNTKRKNESVKGKTEKNNIAANNGRRKRKMTDVHPSSNSKTAKIDRMTKPFSRLLEGVTIVISGYQNPLRGELRSKACAMGARYKADWDTYCTHLICAFVNTPKFHQVRGRGKIVKKEWVEECHSRRKKLPWRRFALDRSDIGDSSEEEIWEELSNPTSSNVNVSSTSVIASGVNRRRMSSGSDTEEEIERVRARVTANKIKIGTQTPPLSTEDLFLEDTDVDSDTTSQTQSLPLPPLPDIFESIVFQLASDIFGDERRLLHRYIIAYKGNIEEELDGSVEYVITKSPDIAAEVGEEFGVGTLAPEWILDCSDAQKLLPTNEYSL